MGSYGAADCAHDQFPGVYSRVSASMAWIQPIAEGSLHSSCDGAFIPTPVVMVTGGGSAETSVELLFINGTRLCALPDLPGGRWFHSQSGSLACGGSGSSSEQT